jgi:hypothetical protein
MPPTSYPSVPVPEAAEGYYSRLCPGNWAPFDEESLTELATIMRDSEAKRRAREKPTEGITTIPSGYVYLGQFIDHDITHDIEPLQDAGPKVERTPNYRTPRFDLDHLYGKGPGSVPSIYEQDGRLKLGPTQPVTVSAGRLIPETLDDLPRDPSGSALVIDSRNEENLVIAQLHVLFAKFHNRVLQLLREQPEISPGPVPAPLFEQARRFVTWHYQWIIVHDYLTHIIREAVLDDIARNGPKLFSRWYTAADYPVALPVEFTVAAYRFGHSTVQNTYFLNDHIGVRDSAEIITMTNRGGGVTARLPANYVIGWDHFFAGLPGQLNPSQKIDTFIAEMLYNIPPPATPAFRHRLSGASTIPPGRQQMRPPLPELTLKRGSRVQLPSGQEFAAFFHLPEKVSAAQMHASPEDEEFFHRSGFATRTPLWYYLLREAAIEPNSELGFAPDPPLQKLGSTGSRILAEVFCQLLAADADSIGNAGCGWKPPKFIFGLSRRPRAITSMASLIDFVES